MALVLFLSWTSFSYFIGSSIHTLPMVIFALNSQQLRPVGKWFVFCHSYITGYKSELWKQDLLFIFPFKNASYLLTLHRNLMIECWKVFKSPRFGIKVSFAMMEGGNYIVF
jgi:hypothetical protein